LVGNASTLVNCSGVKSIKRVSLERRFKMPSKDIDLLMIRLLLIWCKKKLNFVNKKK
jgi:hypothetical protein